MPGVELNGGNMAILPPMDELTASVHINVAEIPAHVRDDLAAATLELIRGILRQPGGREALNAKIRAKKAVV